MEPISGELLFSQQWKSRVSGVCDSLERDDLRFISTYNSWDEVYEQMVSAQEDPINQTSSYEFVLLPRALQHLRSFMGNLSQQVKPTLGISIFWGLLGLITKLCQDEGDSASRVLEMLRELCLKIEILNNYRQDISNSVPQIQEVSFLIALTFLSFFSRTINFMRSDEWYEASKGSSKEEWKPLEQQYASIIREIDESIARIQRLISVAKRPDRFDVKDIVQLQSMLSLSSQTPQTSSHQQLQANEEAKLPCFIPPPFRTSRFFDRADIIVKMEDFFSELDSEHSFRSLALHGLGGVGKSSVALRYAEKRMRDGELDAMFWVPSEKAVTIRQGFTEIAMRLKLPGVQPADDEENHALVLNWLQHTQCRWLIIYDNVESMDLLLSYWPAASRGQAIITARNHQFAFRPADGGLEIVSWDAQTGSQFLIHLLSTDIGAELAMADIKSANQLSEKLSGHALAISHMAGLIHRRSWSIAEFVDLYNRQPQKMHGVSGNSSINALWDISFNSLDPQSLAILGVLSFTAPESIPQSIFEPQDDTSLPESLTFCMDSMNFWDAIDDLLTRALLKRDKNTKTLSVHRLVQTSFKYFMTPEMKQQSFNDAVILIHLVFPQLDGVSQLYQTWDRCTELLPHVLSLKDAFREEITANRNFKAPWQFCELANLCERYMLEISLYAELDDLLKVDQMALGTVPLEDQINDMPSSITSYKGQLFVRTGRAFEGVKILKKSHEIRVGYVPEDLRETAWANENAANGIATINEFAEALIWHERAISTWLRWAEMNSPEKTTYPAVLKKSYGQALIWSGRREQARIVLNQGIQQIESTKPYSWAMAAYTHFALGTLERQERKYDASESHFMQAQNMWTTGDQLRNDPFNAACMYRMGCVALDRGNLEASIKHLRDAMVLTDRRKAMLRAEHARCLFKLSEALQQDSRHELESDKLRTEAERLLREIDPKIKDCGIELAYDSQINIQWR